MNFLKYFSLRCMTNGCIALGFSLLTLPAVAQQQGCYAFRQVHRADAGVAFAPGVDVRGNAVAPADAVGSFGWHPDSTLQLSLSFDMATRYGLQAGHSFGNSFGRSFGQQRPSFVPPRPQPQPTPVPERPHPVLPRPQPTVPPLGPSWGMPSPTVTIDAGLLTVRGNDVYLNGFPLQQCDYVLIEKACAAHN